MKPRFIVHQYPTMGSYLVQSKPGCEFFLAHIWTKDSANKAGTTIGKLINKGETK